MFHSLLQNVGGTLSYHSAMVCTGVSLLVGIIIAFSYRLTGKCSKNFFVSLILLPCLVQTIIMLVNGNLGTGVAIVGAFSLIRFRSIPGNSREITCVFFSMVTGLATGTGYVTYAIFITAVVVVAMVLFSLIPVDRRERRRQNLKITIYEDLDYTEIFEDLFEKYLKFCEVQMVKTVNMGSMYQIVYCIEQKDRKKEKEFIDELRCRNGNLNIVCSKVPEFMEQL